MFPRSSKTGGHTCFGSFDEGRVGGRSSGFKDCCIGGQSGGKKKQREGELHLLRCEKERKKIEFEETKRKRVS